MKKIKIMCLMGILFASSTFAEKIGTTMREDHWSYDSLQYIADKKILKGSIDRFDGTQKVTKSEFIYSLSRLLELLEKEKASQEDIKILESLILQYSDELNQIGFDTKTFDDKLENIHDSINIIQERLNENEKKIDVLLKKIEKLENRR